MTADPQLLHFEISATDVNPPLKGQWLWWKSGDAKWWMAFWNGGSLVDFYGPFVPSATSGSVDIQ